MGGNRPKRQHYVPRLLIKNFLNQDGRVWLGDTGTGRVFCTGPGNAFVDSEQYTRYGFGPDAEEKDYRYEEAISNLESEVGPVVAEIVDSVRRRRPPKLSGREVCAIQRFILLQARRTAESRRRVSSRRDPDGVFFEAAASVFVGQGHDPPPKDVLLAEPGMRGVREADTPQRRCAVLSRRSSWSCRRGGEILPGDGSSRGCNRSAE